MRSIEDLQRQDLWTKDNDFLCPGPNAAADQDHGNSADGHSSLEQRLRALRCAIGHGDGRSNTPTLARLARKPFEMDPEIGKRSGHRIDEGCRPWFECHWHQKPDHRADRQHAC